MLFHRHRWIEDKSERKIIPPLLSGKVKITNMYPDEIGGLISSRYIYFYTCSKCGSQKVVKI